MLLQMDKSVEDYLAFAEERTRAFLASPPTDLFDLTKEIDSLIRDMCGRVDVNRPFPLFLCMNAYYLFLASVRSAISGHVSGVFPLARSGLESACYAFLMKDDSALESVWIDRDKGDQQRSACRRAFTSAPKDARNCGPLTQTSGTTCKNSMMLQSPLAHIQTSWLSFRIWTFTSMKTVNIGLSVSPARMVRTVLKLSGLSSHVSSTAS